MKLVLQLSLLLAAAAAGVCASVAFAHSGRSGIRIDQETTIEIREDAISISYATQLNRQGAYLEFLRMDHDGDGRLSPAERARYFAEQGKKLVGGLEIAVDGKQLPLVQLGGVELSMPFRKLYRFEVPHVAGWQDGATVEFHNDNYLDFPGTVGVDLDPGTAADIVYDSREQQQGEDAFDAAVPGNLFGPQQRDVVFRYRRGTGRNETDENVDAAAPAVVGNVETGGFANRAVELRPGATAIALASAALLLCVLSALIGRVAGVPASRMVAVSVVVFGVGALLVACVDFDPTRPSDGGVAAPSGLQAVEIFQRLHRNIYRAFDAPTESDVYDVLAEGLQGEVLDEVYNEVYEALMMRGAGATRFSVRRVKPIATEILPAERRRAPAFRVRYRWRVYGTVTHFGHTHARFNEYEALYLMKHNGRSWRISGSQVRQNKRVTIGQS